MKTYKQYTEDQDPNQMTKETVLERRIQAARSIIATKRNAENEEVLNLIENTLSGARDNFI